MIIAARAVALIVPALMLAACGSGAAPPSGNDADSFAARIGAGAPTPAPAPVPAATVAPTIAPPQPGAAPGAFAAGTATDPQAANCGATVMGPFIGKLADQPTRAAIVQTLGRADNLRFVVFGSEGTITPDPTSPRLSIMLDAQNIIRDARCG